VVPHTGLTWSVQGWVTLTLTVHNQAPKPTQHGYPFLGRCGEYQDKLEGNMSLIALAMHQTIEVLPTAGSTATVTLYSLREYKL